MPEAKDEELLIAAGQGDRTSFGILVERHHHTVIRFIYRFLGDRVEDTAEDLAQDVFLSAWKAAPAFRPKARVLTWLLRITTNACLNYQRTRRLRRTTSLGGDEMVDKSGPRCGPGEARAVVREQVADIRRAIANLPPTQRAAIVLRHFHDLAYAEIAEALETSVSAAESLLFRARRTLRRTLAATKKLESPQVLPELGAESFREDPVI